MPEVYMSVEWPNGQKDFVYSPSSVIRNFFNPEKEMSVSEFREKVIEALNSAGDRVREVYGFECTSATMEMNRICSILDKIKEKDKHVKILSL